MNSSEILHRALNHSSQGPNVKDITNGNHPKKFVIVEEEKLVPKKSFIKNEHLNILLMTEQEVTITYFGKILLVLELNTFVHITIVQKIIKKCMDRIQIL